MEKRERRQRGIRPDVFQFKRGAFSTASQWIIRERERDLILLPGGRHEVLSNPTGGCPVKVEDLASVDRSLRTPIDSKYGSCRIDNINVAGCDRPTRKTVGSLCTRTNGQKIAGRRRIRGYFETSVYN